MQAFVLRRAGADIAETQVDSLKFCDCRSIRVAALQIAVEGALLRDSVQEKLQGAVVVL